MLTSIQNKCIGGINWIKSQTCMMQKQNNCIEATIRQSVFAKKGNQ